MSARASLIPPRRSVRRGLDGLCFGMALVLAWFAGAGTAVGAGASSGEPSWWAFQPLASPQVPASPGQQTTHPVDAFVLQKLSARGLQLNAQARPRELLRRLFFDLIGLPPSPAEVAAFERDPSPAAWSRWIDDLLARPQYGERWGRHWLDVVRFAQSNGYERDSEKLEAWRYRDYVIRAFNQDKPYDRFVREQVAGDELAPGLLGPDRVAGQEWRDAVVATGFLKLGVLDDEPDDKLQAEYDELDDMVSTSGAAFLGMTVGCARCHDHKFDPISQQDYYSFLALFRSMKPGGGGAHSLESPLFAPLASPAQIEEWKAAQGRKVEAFKAELAVATDDGRKKAIQRQIDEVQKASPPFEWALAARERADAVPAVHLLSRGNPRSPGVEVQPGFLKAAGGGSMEIKPGTGQATAGRRRALAEWIASPVNPLTARVMVNRVWHHHFGRGIVRTTTDFGKVGSLPTHPELLDWLATEFIRSGWSVKSMHRLILTSRAWMQSSAASNPAALAADPGNELLWRQNLRRLDAEALRDSLLAISGTLNLEAGGRGFFPAMSGEVLAGGSRPGTDWQVSTPDQLARRSIYTYIRRSSMVPLFEAFDYNNVTSPLSERPVTTVAPQALMLLNDAFVQEQASALAARVSAEAPGGAPERQIERIWSLATSRKPLAAESRELRNFWKRQVSVWSGLDDRLSFRPDVPDTLSTPYFQALPASRFLVGPAEGWTYEKGRWPREYEGNKALDPGRGPFALWQGAVVTNGVLTVDVVPQLACSQVGILWRAAAGPEGESGYELLLEPRDRRASVRRVSAAHSQELASFSGLELREGRVPVRLEVRDGRFSVWFHGSTTPALVALDGGSAPPSMGRLGVRAWGAAVSLDRFQWTEEGAAARPLWPARDRGWARQKALEAVCLLVMNLNELAYVD